MHSPARRLRQAALIVLVAGWLAAAAIYALARRAPDEAAAAAVAAVFDDTSREQQQVERLGGETALLTLRLHRWLASLWHGPRLAGTVAVLSTAVGLLGLHIAGLMDEGGDED